MHDRYIPMFTAGNLHLISVKGGKIFGDTQIMIIFALDLLKSETGGRKVPSFIVDP